MAETFRVYFWKNEEIGRPPATRIRKILYKNLISATLTTDINLYNLIHLAHLDGVSFNGVLLPGSSGPEGAHKSYDVTHLMESGDNMVRLDYTSTWLVGPWGIATVYLDVTAEKVEVPPSIPTLEWWHWLLIGGIGLVVAWGFASYLSKKA